MPNTIEDIMKQYDEEPSVVAFSISMWNEQLSLEVAKKLRESGKIVLCAFGVHNVRTIRQNI